MAFSYMFLLNLKIFIICVQKLREEIIPFLALSLILCKHQKVQKTKMYFREVVYRPLDCILAEDGAFVKGGAAVHLDP